MKSLGRNTRPMADTLRQPKTISAQTFLKQGGKKAKSGLLRKKKGILNIGVWPVRFIIISEGYIYCYKDERSEAPKSTYSLLEYNQVEEDVNKDNLWRVIALKPNQPEHRKVISFACLSEHERKEWVDVVHSEIRSVKNRRGSKSDISDEHYYEDVDEGAESSPGPLGLKSLLKSTHFKAVVDAVTGAKGNRYHDLKLGKDGNKENWGLPADVTDPSPDQPPGPLPPRLAKPSLGKGPPPAPPSVLLAPGEEPLSQTTALSPSCPRKHAPPPPKPPRSLNISAVPEKQTQPSSSHASPPPSISEPKPESELGESVSPPFSPRLPPPRLLTSSKHSGDGFSEPEEHIYVNVDDNYKAYEFPPATGVEKKTLVDLCLINDRNPNRLRLNSILMSTGEYGAYFVRFSRKGDQKVLSFFSIANKVNEYIIFEDGGKFTLEQKTKSPRFDTLESLLEHYKTQAYVIETNEHLGRGIHEIVDMENVKTSNESKT